jgi:RNase adapter protein RapZ
MDTKLFVITGLSGAGKSQALNILEDLGFFCVDNLPVMLLPRFAELCREQGGKLQNVAVGIDVRAGRQLQNLENALREVRGKDISARVIFFTANDLTLLKRFSETRRRHPLGKRVVDAIKKERQFMRPIIPLIDKEIDTSYLTIGELKEILAKELSISPHEKMSISIQSFGYKYGIPPDGDIVMDVRFLPNPNYIPSLRLKTGKDERVKSYVKRQKLYRRFITHFLKLISFLVPNYIKEGKSYLTIAIGCTGGRHRSVVIAEHVAQVLKTQKYAVQVYHRDMHHGL